MKFCLQQILNLKHVILNDNVGKTCAKIFSSSDRTFYDFYKTYAIEHFKHDQ